MERDFTFIDDVVEGIFRCLLTLPNNLKKVKADIFYIGNSRTIILMDFIALMEDCIGKKSVKEFLPMKDGDVKITYADTSLIQKEKVFSPNSDLK